MILTQSTVFAQTHLKEEIFSEPKKMCAYQGEICVDIDAGVVGILKNPMYPDELAYGFLAKDTVLSWVKLPKGARINFLKLKTPGFYADEGWDFEITFNRELTYAGVIFNENVSIGFDRYQKVFNSDLKKYVYIPYEAGMVRVYGNPKFPVNLEGMNFSADNLLSLKTKVGFLDNNTPSRLQVIFGRISEDGFYPSVRDIPVAKGDLLNVDHANRSLTLRVIGTKGRIVSPENILADEVSYNINTGLISGIDLAWENTALINGLLFTGRVSFDDFGKIHKAEKFAGNIFSTLVPQTANGIYFDRGIGYHGFIEFWPNGGLMTAPTLNVKENHLFLPQEIVTVLPDVLNDSDRIRFFLDQRGTVRVIVLENYSQNRNVRIYLANPNRFGDLEFTLVDLKSDLGQMILESQRDSVEPVMIEYLKNL